MKNNHINLSGVANIVFVLKPLSNDKITHI